MLEELHKNNIMLGQDFNQKGVNYMAKENVGYKIQLGVTEAKKGIKELNKALGSTKMTIDDVGKSIKTKNPLFP